MQVGRGKSQDLSRPLISELASFVTEVPVFSASPFHLRHPQRRAGCNLFSPEEGERLIGRRVSSVAIVRE